MESEGNPIIVDDLENPPVQMNLVPTVKSELQVSDRTSLDFSHYLTTKKEFEAKQQEFEAKKVEFEAEEEKFKTKKTEFEAANITQDQKNSLETHKLDYALIGSLEQKPLPDNRDVLGVGHVFDKAIFVGFLNEVTGTNSGPHVFLKTNSFFTTSDYEDVNPAKDKDANGERIPTFIDNEGYRFVPVLFAAAKTASQGLSRVLAKKDVGGKSKKRVKKNSKNKSKRRYKK